MSAIKYSIAFLHTLAMHISTETFGTSIGTHVTTLESSTTHEATHANSLPDIECVCFARQHNLAAMLTRLRALHKLLARLTANNTAEFRTLVTTRKRSLARLCAFFSRRCSIASHYDRVTAFGKPLFDKNRACVDLFLDLGLTRRAHYTRRPVPASSQSLDISLTRSTIDLSAIFGAFMTTF